MLSKREARRISKDSVLRLSDRAKKENRIRECLREMILHSLEKRTSLRIISYVADEYEIDPVSFAESRLLSEQGASFFFPKVQNRDLVFIKPERFETGAFNIQEPVGKEIISPQEADLILVPALAWSFEGARLGRGKGFYDHALSGVPQASLIGLTFESLFPCEFLAEEHDIRAGIILTDKKNHCFPKKNDENSVR
ncbi:5-formyltetrahydrofolate cyclo-ligase [Leptospira inadai serovar Lyme str. 10]|uniref:5-formyltetrahydrofolate cyclo-ligase n=2 Tax=Leptospira inadai serovar Lyme TaxID=293084 RepID=V6HNW1_9LEPT|nr:5-formyltetrahydrofolate cyclo-ligase [Leptospira inadai]EQA38555.1 5-formyltetrahydrofolate cyclo-ligase [Leptospira inadai serovar Lyme str. 10]PNV76209.1 5-formyltetrahydrofolate cyclo-ligase [Leptospira inadai serovar Lyme]